MITILSLRVYNTPGVLDRVAGLFRHNGWNIESISAGVIDDGTTGINISFKNQYVDMKHLSKQISKMDFVKSWEECTAKTHFMRELLLIKIHKEELDALTLPQKNVIHEDDGLLWVECAASPSEIDEALRSVSALECARSGGTIISKGGLAQ